MTARVATLQWRERVADRTTAFHLSKPAGFDFRPGQTIDLAPRNPATAATDAGSHTFSIVSAPCESGLTVATHMRDTPFKRALDALAPGATLEVAGPFGSLTLHGNRARAAVLVAGGIGITPFISMLRQAAHERREQRLVLAYSNRRRQDAAFLEELEGLQRRLPSFVLAATMTAPDAGTGWKGRTGHIDSEWMKSLLKDLRSPVAYVAGPPAFVAAMRAVLDGAGVEDDDIRSEDFAGY